MFINLFGKDIEAIIKTKLIGMLQNERINMDIDGTGFVETVDVLRQGDIFIINRGGGNQVSIINDGEDTWRLINGVADQQSVINMGKALRTYFNLK